MMPHNSQADHIYTHPVTAAQLYLGSVTAAQDPDHLSTLSVRHLVTVMWAPPPQQEGVERHHVRIRDANDEHMSPFFDEASATIEGWLGAGKNTMIHCSSGVSRSATIALGYLISKGHSLVDAFCAVHAARPVICPGTTFFGNLRQLEQTTGKSPSMTLVQYYGYTVQANAGAGVAYDVCVAAVERFGYANDYALMQAIAHAAESAKDTERADAKREEGADAKKRSTPPTHPTTVLCSPDEQATAIDLHRTLLTDPPSSPSLSRGASTAAPASPPPSSSPPPTWRMRLTSIPTSSPPANSLRALLCSNAPPGEVTTAVVFLHGFPSISVHPCRRGFAGSASSFARKLTDNVLKATDNCCVLSYNASGIAGSDAGVAFYDKTLRREVADARDVIRYVRAEILPLSPLHAIHVVGLSTGSIVAALLRGGGGGGDDGGGGGGADGRHAEGCHHADANPADANMTLTCVAGLLDLNKGLHFDFSEEQLADFDSKGFCNKDFWLPPSYVAVVRAAGAELGSREASKAAAVAAAKEAAADAAADVATEGKGEGKEEGKDGGAVSRGDPDAGEKFTRVGLCLGAQYRDDYGALCILDSVRGSREDDGKNDGKGRGGARGGEGGGGGDAPESLPPPPPLFVVHGDADRSVPLAQGLALHDAACEPKDLLVIKKASHLLSNSKHFKKFTQALVARINARRTQLNTL